MLENGKTNFLLDVKELDIPYYQELLVQYLLNVTLRKDLTFAMKFGGKELDHEIFCTNLYKIEVLIRGCGFGTSAAEFYSEVIDIDGI